MCPQQQANPALKVSKITFAVHLPDSATSRNSRPSVGVWTDTTRFIFLLACPRARHEGHLLEGTAAAPSDSFLIRSSGLQPWVTALLQGNRSSQNLGVRALGLPTETRGEASRQRRWFL